MFIEKLLTALGFLPKTNYAFELPPWPLYFQMLVGAIGFTIRGIWGAIVSITTLQWYDIIIPPLGIWHVVYAFLYNFWQLPHVIKRRNDEDWFYRWVSVVDSPTPDQLPSRPKGKLWMPKITWSMAPRGIAVPGLTTLQHWYMFTVVTVQLSVFSTWRVIQYIFNFGRYKRSTSWDPKKTYLQFVNTSMCAWYEPDENGDPTKGSFTFYNMKYGYRQTQLLNYAKTQFLCDHNTREITKMILITEADPEMCIESKTIVSTDPLEISQTAIYVGASGCHAQVHWWANGVGEITQWKLAHHSFLWTQFFNWAGLNQSYFFMRANQKNDNVILVNNLLQGFPVHNNIPDVIAEWEGAYLHHMARDARTKLTTYFNEINKPISPAEMNCLLAATIFHSGDHYYLDKYSAVAGVNPIFLTDNTVLRLTIVAGYNWLFPKFKVTQFKDTDDVCQILYDCANKYDPEFANGLLTMGIAI